MNYVYSALFRGAFDLPLRESNCTSRNFESFLNLDRIIIMKKGEIIEQGLNKQIFESPKKDYTKALLSWTYTSY